MYPILTRSLSAIPLVAELPVQPTLQGYESIHRLITQKIKAVLSYNTFGSNYPNTWRNASEHLVPQYKNRFATNNVFQLSAVCSVSRAVKVPHD